MGLMAAGEVESESVRRGVEYLLETQKDDGTWDEPWFTGTGFPRVFFLKYHLYRIYFPLMALAAVCAGFVRDKLAPRDQALRLGSAWSIRVCRQSSRASSNADWERDVSLRNSSLRSFAAEAHRFQNPQDGGGIVGLNRVDAQLDGPLDAGFVVEIRSVIDPDLRTAAMGCLDLLARPFNDAAVERFRLQIPGQGFDGGDRFPDDRA